MLNMSRTDKIISNFLMELHSEEVQGLFESLDVLLEHLENKVDPDPEDLQIVNSAYQSIEKLRTLEGYLKVRASNNPKLTGNKLQDLYDKAPSMSGSEILFEG